METSEDFLVNTAYPNSRVAAVTGAFSASGCYEANFPSLLSEGVPNIIPRFPTD